ARRTHAAPLPTASPHTTRAFAVPGVARETQLSPSLPEVVQVMLGAAAHAGNPSAPKESPGTGLVTPDSAVICGTTRYLRRGPALFYGENGGSRDAPAQSRAARSNPARVGGGRRRRST